MSERIPWSKRFLRARYWIYALVVILLLVLRVMPALRSRVHPARPVSTTAQNELRIAGLDTAPVLIPRLVAYFQTLYPKMVIETRAGGTIPAVEDILNRRADVAFVNRPLTAPEDSIVRATGDSLMVFPVALSATLVLVSKGTPLERLTMPGLRRVLLGYRPPEWPGTQSVPVYAPDPASGLWDAIAGQLGLADTVGANVTWVTDDREAAQAAAAHPGSIALVSSLAFDPADAPGCRAVPLSADAGISPAEPTDETMAGGRYPLFHYLYAACRFSPGATAAGFVSFMSGEKGQMLVRQEGFLPAREIAREIELGQMPVGMR